MKKIKNILILCVLSIFLFGFIDGGKDSKNQITLEYDVKETLIKIDCNDNCDITVINNSDNSIVYNEKNVDECVKVSVKSGSTYFVRIEDVNGEVSTQRLIIK